LEINKDKKRSITWRGLFFLTFFSSFGYILLEWLFVVTMPSFLTNVSWLIKFEILIFVSACVISLSLLLVSCFFLLAKIFQGKKNKKLVFNIAAFIPSTILSALTLILFDNFTYTIFDFGIIKTTGIIRGLYGIGFIGFLLSISPENLSLVSKNWQINLKISDWLENCRWFNIRFVNTNSRTVFYGRYKCICSL